MERTTLVSMADFKAVYYSSRCLLQHCDPYDEAQLTVLYHAEEGSRGGDPWQLSRIITRLIYPPTVFVLTVPFALLSFGPAHVLWMIITAGMFALATLLMWDISAGYAPRLSGALCGLLLAGSELFIEVGNAAGIAISLCTIAAWCFIRERFIAAGVLSLALSLVVKPHDAGFIWLYFVLAGGATRKTGPDHTPPNLGSCSATRSVAFTHAKERVRPPRWG